MFTASQVRDMTDLRGSDLRVSRRKWILGDRGASAVEAAIVTPLVMALFFGVIEFGFVFKDYLAVAGAVRAGVRIASANPHTITFAQVAADSVARTGGAMNFNDVQQLWVYKVAPVCLTCALTDKPVGFTDFSNCTVCVKFKWDAVTKQFVKWGPEDWPSTNQNACSSSGPGGTGGPDRIGVYLELKHDAFTKFVFSSLKISEASILSLEPIPTSAGCQPTS
jgi:Flp pilus assembly protein TadG